MNCACELSPWICEGGKFTERFRHGHVVLDYFEAAGAIFFNVGVVKNQPTLTADSRCRGKKFATMVELSTEVLVGE